MRDFRIVRTLMIVPICLLLLTLGANSSEAQEQTLDLKTLKREMDELRRRDAENRKTIEELKRKIEQFEEHGTQAKPKPPTALEKAVVEAEAEPAPVEPSRPALLSTQLSSGTTLRLIDVSLDVLAAAGSSSAGDEIIQLLQGGGHDPRQRGFTLQQAELGLSGAVDPYVNAQAYFVFNIDPEGETQLELEEAFLTTQALPAGLQLKAGFYQTEFGRINPQHPHQWRWQDQPFINTRFFGGDALRQTGVRLGWLMPLPFFSELLVGVQQPRGETMVSFLGNDEVFEERPIGGRPFVDRSIDSISDLAWSFRWSGFTDLSPEVSGLLGFSAALGPNATGDDGYTYIYGTDLTLKWRPTTHFRGWPFVEWQTEVMKRDYKAATFAGENEDGDPITIPQATLRDWGLYTQLLYGFTYRWAAGARFEYGTGRGDNVDEDGDFVSRNTDPFRSDRYRISPMLLFHPTEFLRLRLQYSYDHADFLKEQFNRSKDAHSVWMGVEFSLGAHPAHTY